MSSGVVLVIKLARTLVLTLKIVVGTFCRLGSENGFNYTAPASLLRPLTRLFQNLQVLRRMRSLSVRVHVLLVG